MEQAVKQRLTGSIVLVSLSVIFLPLVLDGQGASDLPGDLFKAPATPIKDPVQPNHSQASEQSDAEAMREESAPESATDDGVGDASNDSSDDAGDASSNNPNNDSLNDSLNDLGDLTQPVRQWNVQLATFPSREMAEQLAERVREQGYEVTIKVEHGKQDRDLYVVVLLMEGRYDEVEAVSQELEAQDARIRAPIIRRRR